MLPRQAITSYRRVNCLIVKKMMSGVVPNSCKSRVLSIRKKWAEKLDNSGVPEAELCVRYIVQKVLGQDSDLTDITKEKEIEINEMCMQRMKRKPVQYIIGDWDFRHLTLILKPPVFIPRPETEDLVDLIGNYHELSRVNHTSSFRFIEVGCGSGAISLSLLSEYPKIYADIEIPLRRVVSCVAIDINPDAVCLTKLNGKRYNLQDRLTVTEANIGDFSSNEQFDAIISNPPYIPSHEICHLQPEVKSYEDRKALCGGEDGMDVIKDIFLAAPRLLKPNGSIWLEVDIFHPSTVRQWIYNNPSLALEVKKFYDDFSGR